MKLYNTDVPLGTNAHVRIPVSRLPSGTAIFINAHVFRAKQEGPTALVLAGVHGDEINGIELVRHCIQSGVFEHLVRGTVIAVPILNIYGFLNFSREVPDGKDVNRSFPGSKSGSLASRVASALSTYILPLVDFGIDFHTGGRSLYNHPQVRYTADNERSRELAEDFRAPVLLSSKPPSKSLRRVSMDKGVPILVFEGGESLRVDGSAIDAGIKGLWRVLVKRGLLEEALETEESLHFSNSSWLRSPRAGLFLWEVPSGNWVKKGDILGYINDPYGQESTPVYAKIDGFIIGHNNAPVVHQGDALFHVAVK